MIRDYGILNDQVAPGDGPLYGIPYPGVFVTDEEGIVVAKFFHDSYKVRESPEILIDAALGRVSLGNEGPSEQVVTQDIRITASIHGGRGTIRQGIMRHVVVRFELSDGLHIYGQPVPEGMVPTTVTVEGPAGLIVHDPILPPTEPLKLASLDLELRVWSGTVDILVPIHAVGELASEVRPLDIPSVPVKIAVRYQACDDQTCMLPQHETIVLDVPLDVIDIPKIALHTGHGQREGNYDGSAHVRRLLFRKVRSHPIGFLHFIGRSIKLELAARMRRKR